MNHSQGAHSRAHHSLSRLTTFRLMRPWLSALLASLFAQFSVSRYPWMTRFCNWKIGGVFLGTLLFCAVITHADPASAQLFNNVESQVKTIFGSNIDASIITFMFGVLRIVVWVTSVGFILFAVYQAQRGEQWQPLMQNAFIVVAAVVIVEGMSQLFFGSTTAGGT